MIDRPGLRRRFRQPGDARRRDRRADPKALIRLRRSPRDRADRPRGSCRKASSVASSSLSMAPST
ncbi:hypothetical protein ACPA9J_22795 [Pseudomonas aeruginosa]